MKKLLTLFAFALVAFTGNADELRIDVEIDGINYVLYTSSYTAAVIHKSNHYSGNVYIPSSITYNGSTYNVTSIGEQAFYCCTGLAQVSIPESVTSIGKSAFMGCTSLTFVNIQNGVTNIRQSAFQGCTSLSEIEIPASVTSIGQYAFYGCSALRYVEIHEDVRNLTIWNDAFRDCFALRSIVLRDGIESIGDQAFMDCTSLKTLEIGKNTTNIGNILRGCSSLIKITVHQENPKYDSRDNCNAIIETSTNTLVAGCMNTVIPNTITSIRAYAFNYCYGLMSVTIPANVTSIDDNAFNWTDLISVTVENPSPISIDNFTFSSREYTTLYVPVGAKAAYQEADYWKDFKEIIEKYDTQITMNGDMNHDGEYSIMDVMKLVNIILGNDMPSYKSCPDSHHPHLIDLGLPSGTKWACCNVGADTPEAYGGYYAWGETEEKSCYELSTYIHCDGSCNTYHDLGSDIAGTQYDVAHVKWGGAWVMPSCEQFEELVKNCTYIWTSKNNVYGGEFIGPNGGTIFLPPAGVRFELEFINAGYSGSYWSSTQNPSYSEEAYDFFFRSYEANWSRDGLRRYGLSVRPVSR